MCVSNYCLIDRDENKVEEAWKVFRIGSYRRSRLGLFSWFADSGPYAFDVWNHYLQYPLIDVDRVGSKERINGFVAYKNKEDAYKSHEASFVGKLMNGTLTTVLKVQLKNVVAVGEDTGRVVYIAEEMKIAMDMAGMVAV